MVVVADASVAVRGDLKPFLADVKGTERVVENLGQKLDKALSPRSLSANAFGKGPAELARSFDRAADSANEAFDAVRKLDRQNIDTAKARKYADTLDDIGIEAQQTLADLRDLQKADPRFNTPQIQAAADQLDRVGREAADSARSLRDVKGVGASTEFERMAHEAREAGVSLGKANTTLGAGPDGLLGKLKGIKGALLGLGIGLGAQQLLSFAGDTVQAFSDLEQSGRSVQTIFGESANVIEQWSERAAKAAGLSKREVNEAASVMGQTLLNMGYNATEAADMVVVLQQRAADLALAFGKDPQDAILAISSVLRGERDTIEKFGVSIKQADVENRILALGLDTSTDEAKRNAEAVASLGLVLDQSANFAGRFAGSTEDIAVKLAQMKAQGDNTKATFGSVAAEVERGFFGMFEAADEAGQGVARWIAQQQIEAAIDNENTRKWLDTNAVAFEDYSAKIAEIMREHGLSLDEAARAAQIAFAHDVPEALAESGEAWETYQDQIHVTGQVVEEEVNGFAGTIVQKMEEGRVHVVDVAIRMPGDIAKALRDGRDAVIDAAEQLAEDQENALYPAVERANLIAQLTGDELAAGLASKDAIVRAQAQALYQAIQDRLSQLGAYGWGSAIAQAWADGVASQWGYAHAKAVYLGTSLSGPLEGYSPPKEGPLRDIDKWGANIGRSWAESFGEGIAGSIPITERAVASLAGALSPALPGGHANSGGVGAPAGRTINYNLNVNGVPYQVSTPEEMVERLMDLSAFGDGRMP